MRTDTKKMYQVVDENDTIMGTFDSSVEAQKEMLKSDSNYLVELLDSERSKKDSHFSDWHEAMNREGDRRFAITWEDGGGTEEELKKLYDNGDTVQEVCNWWCEKYDLDDLTTTW